MINRDNLPYRQSTIAIIINQDHKFLIVNKNAYKANEWAFAGGGVEEGEAPTQAVTRELIEELLSDKFTVIAQSKYPAQYEWQDEVIKDVNYKKGKKFRGTQLTQFFVKFTGQNDEVKAGDGIKAVKWVTRDELKTHLVFANQWENAEKVIQEFVDQL